MSLSHFDCEKQNSEDKGFSLVEVLIAVGILSIVSLAISSLFSQQQNEMKALDEKFVMQSLKQSVASMLMSQSSCTSNLTGASTDISDATTSAPSAQVIVLNEFHVGPTTSTPLIAMSGDSLPGKPVGKMVVSKIMIKDIFQTGNPNEYKGTIFIDMLNSSMIRPVKPIALEQIFTIKPPSTAAVINNCGPIGPNITVSCVDLPASCTTLSNTVGNCTSPAIPTGYVLTGGSCTSVAQSGHGRLVSTSAPNAAGTNWLCADRDAGSISSGGTLTSTAHACKSVEPGSTLECVYPNTVCANAATGGAATSPCDSPFSPGGGYILVGGGCAVTAAPPVHFLVTSASDAAMARWNCRGKDVSSGTTGSTIASAIFCRVAAPSTSVLSCKRSAVTVPAQAASMTFASAFSGAGSSITSAGCESTGFVAGGRMVTSIQINSPSAAICLNKDHDGVTAGGQTTASNINCGL